MDFEWDEQKRQRTLDSRGLDFRDACDLFDGRHVYSYPSDRAEEKRIVTIGKIFGRTIAVVWMWRGEVQRIISMRRARDGEEKLYHTLFDER